ncbi:2-dehydropantoate 2-reductase [Alkalibacterium pelagium]|jgi:2-dehydropantoate 2-reductase|uniref:2-dehydropantoate 2-reductase n=1 Tax=Alkalibacterium pelagium TaxID=426702 RepID=A0A1H7MR66_9LACT|nr:2-dehydropantoate 2-reductase [Alkalibacterium pelagium]GEN51197.1 putative 2-dehydropantoate 2-reductase [Alkalibacterium pelagium]SEL13185.1 2-dehydropantoate 2-reductase [Alkalibacterium pelagium]
MNIAIAGSGALGCGFGYMLQKNGQNVTLLDYWEDHIEAIRNNGLTVSVNGVKGTLPMTIARPEEVSGEMDVIFVFTKAMGLEKMMTQINHLIGTKTKIVCLLNGLGHLKTLEAFVDRRNIIMGTTVWTAGIIAPGETQLNGNGPVELQNSHPEEEEAARVIVNILKDSGLFGEYSKNVKYTTWRKACINGTMNALCALLDASIDQLFASPSIDSLLNGIVDEFAAVAKAQDDIEIDRDEMIHYLKEVASRLGSHYPSMHQDLFNRRPTEIDYLNGAVVEAAEKYGIEAPHCRRMTDLIHAKEAVLEIKTGR